MPPPAGPSAGRWGVLTRPSLRPERPPGWAETVYWRRCRTFCHGGATGPATESRREGGGGGTLIASPSRVCSRRTTARDWNGLHGKVAFE